MKIIAFLCTILTLTVSTELLAEDYTLLNVSYDPTREFYKEYNQLFTNVWKAKHAEDTVVIRQSHGGSGKQARSVMEGLEADVVTLALAYDIDAISEKRQLLPQDWQKKLPNNSSPYTSTIVFLVKKGNPKAISDWSDLIKEGVQVITPNPKTSGGARWNYLAALTYALEKYNHDEQKAKAFLKTLFQHVPVLDTGARGATTTFAQRGIGDVLITWENEAHLAMNQLGKDKFEIVYPSISILAEPPVAVVNSYAEKHGNKEIAQEYLNKLYTKEAQKLAAKHFYRPSDTVVLKENAVLFPQMKLKTIDDFGGWKEAQKKHFADGGMFDEIFKR